MSSTRLVTISGTIISIPVIVVKDNKRSFRLQLLIHIWDNFVEGLIKNVLSKAA